MARVTKSNPLCSSMTPKENRVFPEMGSSPTEASRRPSAIITSPLTTEAPERVTAMSSPTTARENFSGGPKLRANPAIIGANRVIPRTPTVPATNEPMAAMPRAAPALPFRAIWYPSMQVTTDAASPGRFRRIEVVEPPYIEP